MAIPTPIQTPLGFACPSTSSDASVPCVLGSFSTGSQASCTPCPAGHSCASTTSLASTPCSSGLYSLPGVSSCTPCPRGSRCPDASVEPVACTSGEYSGEGQVACEVCPAGFSCASAKNEPELCPVGHFAGGGAIVCSACTPGYTCEVSVAQTHIDIATLTITHFNTCSLCSPTARLNLANSDPLPNRRLLQPLLHLHVLPKRNIRQRDRRNFRPGGLPLHRAWVLHFPVGPYLQRANPVPPGCVLRVRFELVRELSRGDVL